MIICLSVSADAHFMLKSWFFNFKLIAGTYFLGRVQPGNLHFDSEISHQRFAVTFKAYRKFALRVVNKVESFLFYSLKTSKSEEPWPSFLTQLRP